MILTSLENGSSQQVFLIQKNALHVERAGAVLYVHKCAKVFVPVIDSLFCTEELLIMSSDNSSEGIRYMDPIFKCSIEILQ